jgi:FixJ family two-component response regulator
MRREGSVVYLIDDDESVRRALQRLLRSAGLDVKAFSSAEEFLQSGNLDEKGACIILDIRMPGLTGFDLQEKLASKGVRIPVISVSAFDDAGTRERTRAIGATASPENRATVRLSLVRVTGPRGSSKIIPSIPILDPD